MSHAQRHSPGGCVCGGGCVGTQGIADSAVSGVLEAAWPRLASAAVAALDAAGPGEEGAELARGLFDAAHTLVLFAPALLVSCAEAAASLPRVFAAAVATMRRNQLDPVRVWHSGGKSCES